MPTPEEVASKLMDEFAGKGAYDKDAPLFLNLVEILRTARQEGFNGGVERTRSVAKENIFCCPECTDSKCDKFYYFDEAIRKLKKEG